MEKNYLDLLLNSHLSLHVSYSNKKNRRYVFQNIWLANAAEQYGIKKCEEEIKNNLEEIIKKTKEEYKRQNDLGPISSNEYKEQIEILDKIIRKKEKNKIVIFGMKDSGKIELEYNF